MPLLRGTVHELTGVQDRSLAILTNDRWNSRMSYIGAAVVRRDIHAVEAPYAVELADGRFATAARVVSFLTPDAATQQDPCLIGPAQGSLSAAELARLEDAFVRFLQLPLLLSPVPRPRRPLGDASTYPNWGDIYLGREPIANERKRFIIVSPNEWNQAAGIVTAVRTTSQSKGDLVQFPTIQRGRIHACCGDLSTFGASEILMRRQDRPTPATCTITEMVAVAKGIAVTHGLTGALHRAGV